MRAASQGLIGRLVMAVILCFIIVSFGFWGIGDIFSGFNANELASVGSTHISVDAYRNAYQADLQRLQQQARRGITNEEARRLGLDRQVLARLLTDAVLDQEATKLGLAIGDADLRAMIRKDEAFRGANGQFDMMRFAALMRDNGLTEGRFVADQRQTYRRQLVSDAVVGGLATPKALAAAVHRYQTETRAIDYVLLPPASAGDVPAPTDAEVQSYYEQRKSLFTAAETRKLVTLAVVPTDLAKPAAVSDEDIRKRYAETKAGFDTPEKRGLQQIIYPDEAAATAAKAKLVAGATFLDLAKDRDLAEKDVDLGTVARAGMGDKAVADAAFALPVNGTSDPVKTSFGYALVHVTGVVPAVEKQLADIAGQLRDELALAQAKTEAARLRDKVEEQRAAGKTLTEAAAAAGLSARTVDAIDQEGRDKAHKPVEGLVDGPALLKAAFAAEVGADTDMIATASGGYAWYEVAAIDPARQLPLADVRAQVEAGWRKDEVARRLSAKAGDLVKALDGGQSLAEVAAAQGNLKIVHVDSIQRGSTTPGQAVVAAVFSVPVHKAASVADPDGGRVLFQVANATVPPMAEGDAGFKTLLENVRGGFLDDALTQYLGRLERTFGVKLNAKAMATALGTGGGGEGP